MTMDGVKGPGPEDGAGIQKTTDRNGTYMVSINGGDVNVDDSVAEGEQLLEAGGFLPADEHVLIQLLDHGTRSIGLDETVNLRGGKKTFRTFRSDRIFRFTLDGRGYEWGVARICEPELRDIGPVADDKIILLDQEGQPDQELGPDDILDLSKPGSERLRTKKGNVIVYLDGDEKSIARGSYTTEELIAALGVAAGYLLNVMNERGQLVPLKPGEITKVKKGMKFVSQVPCGGSA